MRAAKGIDNAGFGQRNRPGHLAFEAPGINGAVQAAHNTAVSRGLRYVLGHNAQGVYWPRSAAGSPR